MKITGRQLRALIRETIMHEEEAGDSTLMIRTEPAGDAKAQIDGVDIETAAPIDVTPGEHIVKLEQGEKSVSFKFTAVSGKTHRLVWNFETNSHPASVGGGFYDKDFTKIETPVAERRRR